MALATSGSSKGFFSSPSFFCSKPPRSSSISLPISESKLPVSRSAPQLSLICTYSPFLIAWITRAYFGIPDCEFALVEGDPEASLARMGIIWRKGAARLHLRFNLFKFLHGTCNLLILCKRSDFEKWVGLLERNSP